MVLVHHNAEGLEVLLGLFDLKLLYKVIFASVLELGYIHLNLFYFVLRTHLFVLAVPMMTRC